MTSSPTRQPVTAGHWSLCFSEIYQRLKAWEQEHIIPVELAPMFFDGWRLRTSGDSEAALLVYQRLHTLLFMTDLPDRFMEEGEPKVLNTYEGWAKILDDSGTPNLHYYAGGC